MLREHHLGEPLTIGSRGHFEVEARGAAALGETGQAHRLGAVPVEGGGLEDPFGQQVAALAAHGRKKD